MKTNRLFHIILIFILPVMCLQAQPKKDSNTSNNVDAPTITITKLDVNDKILELCRQAF